MSHDVVTVLQQPQAAPPPTPRPSVEAQPGAAPRTGGDLGADIRQTVQDALRQAREQQRAALDQQRATLEQQREMIDAARRQGVPIVFQQPGGRNQMIPQGAVDISVAFFVMCAVMLIGFPIARAFARRIDRKSAMMATPPDVNARLERIEQAVDTIAIEVERVSESQRYATRILSEIRALPAPNPLEGPAGHAVEREAVAVPGTAR